MNNVYKTYEFELTEMGVLQRSIYRGKGNNVRIIGGFLRKKIKLYEFSQI